MNKEIINFPHWLQDKFIILVGLMGAGKTKLGRIVATSMGLPFIDTDTEIEKAAGYSVREIFEQFGEQYFRDGERRVIERILSKEPSVLATGGGAYMDELTRNSMKERGIVIWLRADLELLVQRTKFRVGRPLLNTGDTKEILSKLIDNKIYLGLPIDQSILKEFESRTKHFNYLYANSIDFIHEFFKIDNKFNNFYSDKIFYFLEKNYLFKKFSTKFADNGFIE